MTECLSNASPNKNKMHQCTEINEDQSFCPLTLKPLPKDPLEVCYIYSTHKSNTSGSNFFGCGHWCTLQSLLTYVQEIRSRNPNSGTANLTQGNILIVDGHVQEQFAVGKECSTKYKDFERNESRMKENVYFRFEKRHYRLTVVTNAQSRICDVLGLDRKTLKVLSKGKLLHPSPSNSVVDQDDLSRMFLDISTNDIKKGSKPSILVSGTRSNETLNDESTHKWKMFGREGMIRKNIEFSCWLFGFVFHPVGKLIGGMILFVRSIIFLPPPRPPRNGLQQSRDD